MPLSSESISTLQRLGFSSNQAKIYLTLVLLGKSTVKEISQSSGVSREEVYRKLVELQKMGFVESNLSTPKLFSSLPIEKVKDIMLHKKAEEISNLQKDMLDLIEKIKNRIDKKSKKECETIIVPEQHAHLEKAKIELYNLRKSLDCVLSWEKCIGWFSAHKIIFKKLLKKNIHIRWVIEKSNEQEICNFLKQITDIDNKKSFQIRYVSNSPESCLGIYDDRVMLLDTSAASGFIETPLLWSNNPSLIILAKSYFDTMWKNSKKNRN